MTKAERIEFIGAQLAAGQTLQQIGDVLGVSREYVRQLAEPFGWKRVLQPKPPKSRKTRVGRPVKYVEIRAACKARGLPDPYAKYHSHRHGAADRGIEFKMSFEQWWEIWAPHYHERGSRVGCKVMCRARDQGAYEVGNVRIDTVRGNSVEQGMMRRSRRPNFGGPRHRRYAAIGAVLPVQRRARKPDEILGALEWNAEHGEENE